MLASPSSSSFANESPPFFTPFFLFLKTALAAGSLCLVNQWLFLSCSRAITITYREVWQSLTAHQTLLAPACHPDFSHSAQQLRRVACESQTASPIHMSALLIDLSQCDPAIGSGRDSVLRSPKAVWRKTNPPSYNNVANVECASRSRTMRVLSSSGKYPATPGLATDLTELAVASTDTTDLERQTWTETKSIF